MKKLLAILAVAVAMFACANTSDTYPRKTFDSLIRITHMGMQGTYVCTGFVVNPGIALTAHHCLAEGGEWNYAEGMPVIVLVDDKVNDMAVLQIFGIAKPSLRLATQEVYPGDRVYGFGFAEGFPFPSVTSGIVSSIDAKVATNDDSETEPGIVSAFGFIGGQSGGPVTNQAGLVVGMVQRSNGEMSYAGGLKALHALADKFIR